MKHFRVVITPGEPAGIGPEIVVRLAQYKWPVELVVCADPVLLKSRAELLKIPLTLLRYETTFQRDLQKTGILTILPISLRKPVDLGQLCTENSYYVIETLLRACDGCLKGEFSALVTGPVHKGIINEAGIPFSGHTGFLEERSHSSKAVMMFESKDGMRVALATTHQPIREIPNIITTKLLRKVISVLHYDLRTKLGILKPRILVCGLNPHAGEGGHIGIEEVSIINPVLQEMRESGMNLVGPLPADTIFRAGYLNDNDVVLAMYHDQGLPVLKYKGFGHSVNITLGLPFIRTSVDHGTALSLAGKGKADINSFITALNFAIKMIVNIHGKSTYE